MHMELYSLLQALVFVQLFSRDTNKRICILNIFQDEVIRSLFYNKNNDSLITVLLYASVSPCGYGIRLMSYLALALYSLGTKNEANYMQVTKFEGKVVDEIKIRSSDGGYDLLGRTKDQIRSGNQVNAAMAACNTFKLDGLVIVGGGRSTCYIDWRSKELIRGSPTWPISTSAEVTCYSPSPDLPVLLIKFYSLSDTSSSEILPVVLKNLTPKIEKSKRDECKPSCNGISKLLSPAMYSAPHVAVYKVFDNVVPSTLTLEYRASEFLSKHLKGVIQSERKLILSATFLVNKLEVLFHSKLIVTMPIYLVYEAMFFIVSDLWVLAALCTGLGFRTKMVCHLIDTDIYDLTLLLIWRLGRIVVSSLPVRHATKIEKMRECLRSLKQSNKDDDAKVKTTFNTLLTYVKNAATKPEEEKFRKIRLSNVAFQVGRVGLADMAANPFHALFYLVFMLTTCALFSKTWIEVFGSSARDVAKQLKHEHVGTTNGDAWPSRLKPAEGTEPIHPNNGYIGRMCIVALTVLTDFMGAIGSCTDKSKMTRKQSKASNHGHENQKSTKRSQRIKAEARKVKPQSNPVKQSQHKRTNPQNVSPWCPQLDQTATIDAQMIEEMIGQD
ncbi:UBX domain-containing protein 1 [Tanacetum coccineum]